MYALGVVHTYVDQKLLKVTKVRVLIHVLNTGSRHCSNKPKRNRITTLAYAIMSVISPQYNIYTHLSQALLFRLMCHTPINNRGLSIDP